MSPTEAHGTTVVTLTQPAKIEGKAAKVERKADRVAICGFAPSWPKAPFDAPENEWEIWSLNEWYKLLKSRPGARADRWFEIHNRQSPSKSNEEHQNWLKECPIPVYMWDHYDDIPNSLRFPKDEILAWLKEKGFNGWRYMTNSISWMIAFALYEGFKEIGVYGVDMATDSPVNSEYIYQRPSVEYFIGIAEGMGVKIHVPAESDLCHTAGLYGYDSDNEFRIRMKAHKKELVAREQKFIQQRAQHVQGMQQCDAAINSLRGAKETVDYVLRCWV